MKNVIDNTPLYDSMQNENLSIVSMSEIKPKIQRTNSLTNIINIIENNNINSNSTDPNNINIINIYKNDNNCKKIIARYFYWFDSKYFLGISIIILSLILTIYLSLFLSKINKFEIMFSNLIENKIDPLDINSFNSATDHIPVLTNSIDNISFVLNNYNREFKNIIKELENIINKYNSSLS